VKVTFLIQPKLQPIGNSDEWELCDPFTVRVEEDGKPIEIITVPKGFTTDLASVPRLPGAYLIFANRGRRSAILHDYLYSQQVPREWADSVFLAAMQNEVGFISRNLMYWAVRLGGGAYYQTHQQANEAEREAP
jgi:hypothetical protein